MFADRDYGRVWWAGHTSSGGYTAGGTQGGAGTPGGDEGGGVGPNFYSNSYGDNIAYFQGDGLEDLVTTIHGVRNVDPTTQQWTTPDMYEGDISDPMSQAKYMWDNNDPIGYADPTGYTWEFSDSHVAEVFGGMAAKSPTFRAMYNTLSKASAGVFHVTADYSGSGGDFSPNKGKGGAITIGTADSHGGAMNTIAHETTHAHDAATNRAQYNTDVTKGVAIHTGIQGAWGQQVSMETPDQEEVNAYSVSHDVDAELGNTASWEGPDWGPAGSAGPAPLSWSTFSSNYHADRRPPNSGN